MKAFALIAFLLATITSTYANCKGCVSLDEYNFHKVITRFKIALVKFDVAYPYGDKQDTFTKLAEELLDHKEILIVEVGVKDYGEKDNEKIARKYGVKNKDDYPQIQLFIDGKPTQTFLKTAQWTVENLRNLIRDNTDVYIGLAGCLQEFDEVANEFVKDEGGQEELLKRAELMVHNAPENETSTAKIYLVYMKKIIKDGVKFVEQEVTRLRKILESKINKAKQEEMTLRLNILHSFKSRVTVVPKEEL